MHRPETSGRVSDLDRQRDEERGYLIVRSRRGVGGARRRRDDGDERAVGKLTGVAQPGPQGAGNGRQYDVVKRDAERGPYGPDLVDWK